VFSLSFSLTYLAIHICTSNRIKLLPNSRRPFLVELLCLELTFFALLVRSMHSLHSFPFRRLDFTGSILVSSSVERCFAYLLDGHLLLSQPTTTISSVK
jgi:hypothetical protein